MDEELRATSIIRSASGVTLNGVLVGKLNAENYKKLSYCWETVRRESMPRIAEMEVEMTT